MSLAVKNGKLVEVYPVYRDEKECEACSSGGQRRFIFQWDGSRFVLEDAIDVPDHSPIPQNSAQGFFRRSYMFGTKAYSDHAGGNATQPRPLLH
jgi:hypothetical protein